MKYVDGQNYLHQLKVHLQKVEESKDTEHFDKSEHEGDPLSWNVKLEEREDGSINNHKHSMSGKYQSCFHSKYIILLTGYILKF